MAKDRNQTRIEILNAVGRLLARTGFQGLGVNAIAREAGVDKVLIYRYFGGLADLLKAYAEETDFWPDLRALAPVNSGAGTAPTAAERAKQLILAFGQQLRSRPLTQEIMRWELLERNELTDALARYRESEGTRLFAEFQALLDGAGDVDLPAIASLLAAGQAYLILRSKTADVYNGLQLNSAEGWARIERAVAFLVDAALARTTQPKPAGP